MRILRLLLGFLALTVIPALAATPAGPVPLACGASTATPSTGTTSFDMLTFAPDAQCWFNNTVNTLVNAKVFHAMDVLAGVVTVILFMTTVLIPVITDPKSRGSKMIMSGLTFIIFGSITSQAALSRPNDPINYLRGQMLNAWTAVYVPSANAGSALVSGATGTGSVSQNLMNIANESAQLQYDSDAFTRLKDQIIAQKTSGQLGGDYGAVSASVAQLIHDDQSRFQPQANAGTATNIGYFLLMGVFAVFAAIVFSTGFGIIIVALMLPFAFAFAAAGNFGPFKTVLVTVLAGLASTVIVPFAVSVVIDIAFGTPTASMARTLAANRVIIEHNITLFANSYQGCGITDIGCHTENVVMDLSATWEGVRASWVGMIELLVTVVVSLGIGMSQLRRVPALVAGVLGASAGGESSGTGANPFGVIAETLGVAALAKGLAGRAARGSGKKDKPEPKDDPTGPSEAGEGPGGPGSSGSGGDGGAPKVVPPAGGSGSSASASQRLGMAMANAPRSPVAAAAQAASGAAGAVWGAAERIDPSLKAMREKAGAAVKAQKEQFARIGSGAGAVMDVARNGATAVQLGMQARGQRAAEAGQKTASSAADDQGTSSYQQAAARLAPSAAGPSAPTGTKGTSLPPARSAIQPPPPTPQPVNSGAYGSQVRPADPTPVTRAGPGQGTARAVGPVVGGNATASGAPAGPSAPSTQSTASSGATRTQVVSASPASAQWGSGSGWGKSGSAGNKAVSEAPNSGPGGTQNVPSGKSNAAPSGQMTGVNMSAKMNAGVPASASLGPKANVGAAGTKPGLPAQGLGKTSTSPAPSFPEEPELPPAKAARPASGPVSPRLNASGSRKPGQS